jgi:hypothetical protein
VTIKVASGKVKSGITATIVADRLVRITGGAENPGATKQ